MPFKCQSRKREYLRDYKARMRRQKPRIRKPRKLLEGQWATGHSDKAICLTCGAPTTAKPMGCEEPKHHAYFERRRQRNNAYRREKRADARAVGSVYKAGRGSDETRTRVSKRRHAHLRECVFTLLGSQVCVRCGFSDKRALQFDHVYGDGAEHRRANRSGTALLKAILAMPPDDARKRLQVLCANCNMIKRVERGENRRREKLPLTANGFFEMANQ